MVMTISKLLTTIKCTSNATRFDGRADAPVRYRVHCPMKGVHGQPGSHWTPPPGEHSCCIAPAATKATENEATIKQCTIIASCFDSRTDAPVRYRAYRLIEVVQGFDWSHWSPPLGEYCGDNCNWSPIRRFFSSFFIVNSLQKGSRWHQGP